MAFKSDCGGIALMVNAKLSYKATTWHTRLNQIGKHDNEEIIVTYSLCHFDYISKILSKREGGKGITIICHTNYEANAYCIKKAFPDLKIYVSPHAHAKMALIEPMTVWLSSENLGKVKNTFDASIGIQSKEAYDHYYTQVENLLRSKDTRVI